MFNQEEFKNQLFSKLNASSSPVEKIIEETLNDFFPISAEDGKYTLHYIRSYLDKSNFTVPNPEILFATAPLYALFRLENKKTNEFTESEVLLGDFPFLQ